MQLWDKTHLHSTLWSQRRRQVTRACVLITCCIRLTCLRPIVATHDIIRKSDHLLDVHPVRGMCSTYFASSLVEILYEVCTGMATRDGWLATKNLCLNFADRNFGLSINFSNPPAAQEGLPTFYLMLSRGSDRQVLGCYLLIYQLPEKFSETCLFKPEI